MILFDTFQATCHVQGYALYHQALLAVNVLLLAATMKKCVHFSATNLAYEPIPFSPSPGASTSSLPPFPSNILAPSEELPTGGEVLPQMPQRTLTGNTPFLPVTPLPLGSWFLPPEQDTLRRSPTIMPTQIHLLLAFALFSPPQVHCDLSHPLHAINSQLSPVFLEPATYPPLPSLTLICRHISWPISISPSQPTGFVSVMDVFTSIYTGLRLAVRSTEYDALSSRDAKQSVNEAYYARCRLLPDGPERQMETLKGVKRVDFLMGKNRFLGLSGPLEGTHVWELNVS
ncbi:hypothetical protein B0H10DRAFT_1952653 [Mycena sp. CBHHK59/15]|nr:hypothetical protein B0H10DRAFT_1952653 [Mycena sp. CBHHK59/15]